MRYSFWYISLPYCAQLQHKMTKLKVLWRTRTHDGEFSFFSLNYNAVLPNSDSSATQDRLNELDNREQV